MVLGFSRQKGTRTSAVLGVEGLAGGIMLSKCKAVLKPNSLRQVELRGLSALPLAQARRCRSGRKAHAAFGVERGMQGRPR